MHIKEIGCALDDQQVSYVLDDGRIVPLEFSEYSIGLAMPRRGLTFADAGSVKTK
jgi:hypothetical protein